MSDIASAAGVTQSLIHHHFGAKDALWRQVLAGAFEEYGRRQIEMLDVEGHPRGLVRASLAAYFQFLADTPGLGRLLVWAELEGPLSLAQFVPELHGQALGRLRAGQAAGLIRDDVPAEHILLMFQSLCRTWFEERNLVPADDDDDPDRAARLDAAYLEAAWAIFAGGVLAPSARDADMGGPEHAG